MMLNLLILSLTLFFKGFEAAGCTQSRTYPDNKQYDSSWKANKLGNSSTIGADGCLVCSVASALDALGKKIDKAVPTCATLNSYLISNSGYSGNLFVWGSVKSFGLTIENSNVASIADIKKAICDGKIVILNVRNKQHWVLAKSYDEDTFTVMDPGYKDSTTYKSI